MFIAAVFTVARTWKQSNCPMTDDCLKKLLYIYTMEYYSAMRRNEITAIRDNMDRPQDNHAKRNKPDRKS